ncbi:MAG: hypothetical protein ACK5UJ_03400 [Pseudobdellovibrionaceae bacterium]
MALVRNGRTTFQNPGVMTGTQSFQNGNFIKGGLRNRFTGGLNSTFGGYANGHLAPSAFILPQKSGSISTTTEGRGQLSPLAELIPARNLGASQNITLAVSNAQLDQIVSLIASALLNLTGSNAQLAAAAASSANATFQLAVTNALCGAIFSVNTDGTITLAPNASLSALGFMSVNYVPGMGGGTVTSAELQAAKEELLIEIEKTLTKKQYLALKD